MYNELYHHGIKGQRWGIRRTPEQLGHMSEKKRARYQVRMIDKAGKITARRAKEEAKLKEKISKAESKAQERINRAYSKRDLKKKEKFMNKASKDAIKNLTDDELEAKIKRLTNEKRYQELIAPPAKREKFIKKFSKNVVEPSLIDSSRYIMTNYLKAKGLDMVGVEIKKDIGPVLKKVKKDYEKESEKDAAREAKEVIAEEAATNAGKVYDEQHKKKK